MHSNQPRKMSKVFPDIFSSDMFAILTNITCTKLLTALKSQRKALETIKSVIIFYNTNQKANDLNAKNRNRNTQRGNASFLRTKIHLFESNHSNLSLFKNAQWFDNKQHIDTRKRVSKIKQHENTTKHFRSQNPNRRLLEKNVWWFLDATATRKAITVQKLKLISKM